jgi:hypothetical protein
LIVASPDGAAGAYRNATPIFHECELHWEVKLTQPSVEDGIFSEKVFDTMDLEEVETGETAPDQPWITMGWYGLNFSKTLTDPKASSAMTFGMGNLTARRTIQAMEEVVDGTITVLDADTQPVLKAFWRGDLPDPRILEVNPWMPPFNATQWIASIARAMTVAVRRTGNFQDKTHDQVFGQAWDARTMIHVKWVWITLPLLLLFTALIFLVATILRSSKEENAVGIWKTSALAVLFNGLGQDVQEQPGAHDRLGQARSKAKKLDVTLGK